MLEITVRQRGVLLWSIRQELPFLSSRRANLAFDRIALKADIFQRMVVELLKVANCLPDVRFTEPPSEDLRWKLQSYGREGAQGLK
jgi:hypothetical protein